tara:strand:- start:1080 stop:1826 length:747 start_codon:yes stop_codon:yes gene_type:complete
LEIPFEPILFGIKINIHLILEYLAFIVGFRYYVFLRKRSTDEISSNNRLSIIIGATLGALIGSRIIGFLEYPFINYSENTWIELLNAKSIMGGLFGGLLGVEIAKKIIGEKRSSGDLFTFPIILGIFVGRIGCFLSGTNEFTYGKETSLLLGMDLGDGISRHPLALYELVFLVLLATVLKQIQKKNILKTGELFKCFMIAYFSFRFFIEFLKPNEFLILGLSSVQILCITCLLYYYKTIFSSLKIMNS